MRFLFLIFSISISRSAPELCSCNSVRSVFRGTMLPIFTPNEIRIVGKTFSMAPFAFPRVAPLWNKFGSPTAEVEILNLNFCTDTVSWFGDRKHRNAEFSILCRNPEIDTFPDLFSLDPFFWTSPRKRRGREETIAPTLYSGYLGYQD